MFANGGTAVTPYFVTEVDGAGNRVLYKRQPPEPQRIIADHVNKDLVAMLYGVVTRAQDAALPFPATKPRARPAPRRTITMPGSSASPPIT